MDLAYAIPGVVALIEWLLAAALYTLSWYRTKHALNRFGDSLNVAGLVTAAGGGLWIAWIAGPNPALMRSSMAAGLALAALIVDGVLAHRREERLSAALVLGFSVLAQAYAVGQLLWGRPESSLSEALPSPWAMLYTLTGLVAYGGLVVSAVMIVLSATLSRARDRLSVRQLTATIGLTELEWQSWQIALVALSLSVSIRLLGEWWGLGQAMMKGSGWTLITWLLLAAGAYGLMRGAIHRRPARLLLVLACGAGVIAALTSWL